MAVNVSNAPVSIYDLLKDFGFPAAVTLILLFQIGPRLDQVAATNGQVAAQLAVVSAECVPAAHP